MSSEVIRLSRPIEFLPTERRWNPLIPGANAFRRDGLRDLPREVSHCDRADIELAILRPWLYIWASVGKDLTTGVTEETDRSDGGQR